MPKEVQMSIKMERALRDEFLHAAQMSHRPAAQIVREFMRAFIGNAHQPNEATLAAIKETENGGGKHFDTVDELCRDLGISCEK